MQYDHILVRYGELTLKSGNRNTFINQLKSNIKYALIPLTGYKVNANRDRMYVEITEDADVEEIMKRISKVFGVHSVSPVVKVEKNIDQIKSSAVKLARDIDAPGVTFKVDAKRSDKGFPYDTFALQQELGGEILSNIEHLTVDVKNPDYKLLVEIRSDAAYLYSRVIKGAGGLPVGTGGKTLLMLSGGIDSPVAGIEVMKRGVTIEAIHFHSPPFTSEEAKQKVIDLTRIMAETTGEIKLHLVPFTDIQKMIHKKVPENLTMTSTRRMMLKIADKFARQIDAKALVNGENLGQVASQTLGSIYAINAVTNLPILRPLLTLDKDEIIIKAKEIGTFDTSIQPFEDCCTIFTPKNPKTNPRLDKVESFEAGTDFDAMIEEAVANIETLTISKHTDTKQEFDELL
ncbi:tRNA 4-thiouridine(8) synthase ThiI [Macrococcoides caseolyticum subsp. caseolyticum]|uniref:tRNA uracil 4-sulfurtransferase ThiI n=1 Tax=Macrococcoides caseolyticum TaxID=69966 RepID=UPI000CD0E9BF|nr:tRNA uracil 4-sulfurtransferase ThiI [Macrococcus caseolyticus]PNZ70988.1 tRNA 4-thiouridine(8) synthase ThiI [Macrococcus caseolyticus]QPT46854.1 tRNA 4-thiouridine(8) synthase ThiI [Macrococcus caseolyticus]RAK45495.1 tRNA 4-thiouridine(8) synthase ThiI [Macrococcus caseolyticus subsp. caseolyticus]HCD19732.1 tRNA 4-thiouridine(8) synthase ThiI [Macrococcus caseolyticus]